MTRVSKHSLNSDLIRPDVLSGLIRFQTVGKGYYQMRKNRPKRVLTSYLNSRYIVIGVTLHLTFEPRHEISNNVVCATSQGSDQPAHRHSLIRAFTSCLNVPGC